jgi:glutaredoxin-related protein
MEIYCECEELVKLLDENKIAIIESMNNLKHFKLNAHAMAMLDECNRIKILTESNLMDYNTFISDLHNYIKNRDEFIKLIDSNYNFDQYQANTKSDLVHKIIINNNNEVSFGCKNNTYFVGLIKDGKFVDYENYVKIILTFDENINLYFTYSTYTKQYFYLDEKLYKYLQKYL